MNTVSSQAEKIKEISGVNPLKCMKCGKCSASCPAFDEMDIKPHQFVSYVQNENIEALVQSKSLWKCLSCFACVERCPRDVKPGKLIDAARQLVIRQRGQNYLTADEIPELLDEELPDADGYYLKLQKEFRYLQHKFELPVPMAATQWRFLRLRPGNFPHVRLAQLANLYYKEQSLFSRIMEADTLEAVRKLLTVATSPYWEEHFNFRKVSSSCEKQVGKNAQNLIVINTVIPFLYAYGLHKANEELCERATGFLESLKAEDNHIIRHWSGAGLPVSTAADSQALLQLQKEYCDKKDCLRCRFGFEYLRQK